MKVEIIFIEALKREITFHIGKNQDENFQVIDNGNPKDIWFHAKNISLYKLLVGSEKLRRW